MSILSKPLGTKVRFSTYGTVDNVKQFEGEIATTVGGNFHPNYQHAVAQHANIYPTLPEEIKKTTPNDAKAYQYIGLSKADGSLVYIGVPWIVEATIEDVVETIKTITVRSEGVDDSRLRQILEQNNIEVVSIS